MPNAASSQNPALPLPQNMWLHGLLMLILLLFLNLAQSLLGLCALVQFLWMLVAREPNAHIATFGEQLANWIAISARFISGSSDQKPFPWTAWR